MGIFDWISGKEDIEEQEQIQQRSVRVFNIDEGISSEEVVNSIINGDIALIKIVKNVEKENDIVELLNKVKAVCSEVGGDVGRFSESWYIVTPTNIRIQRKKPISAGV